MNFIQLLKRLTGVSLVTSVITLAASLWLAKIMLSEDFGKFSYYQSLLMIFVNIVPFGSGLAVVIYLFSSPAKKYSKIISNSLFFLMPMSAVFSFVALSIFSLSMDNQLDWQIILLLILNAFFMSVCLTGVHFLRTKQLMKCYSVYFGAYTAVLSIGSIVGYSLFQDIKLLYLTTLVALVVLSIFTVVFLHKDCRLSLSYPNRIKTFFWSTKYGLPVVLNSTVMSFMVIGDKIILGSLVGLEQLASYSIAALLASTSLFLVNNFSTAWGGYISKLLPSLTKTQLRDFYLENKKRLLLSIPIGVLAIIGQFIIYTLFYEESYPDLYSIIFVLTVGYCFLGVSKYYICFLSCLGHNYLVLKVSAISCLILLSFSILVFDTSLLLMALVVTFSFFIQLILLNTITNSKIYLKVDEALC